jgi:uncharacterized protein (TIGR03790 family)
MAPEEILVIANDRVEGSVDLAEYYMKKRSIPTKHLLILSLAKTEKISRKDYNLTLRTPVLNTLKRLRQDVRISALVLIYGVPLVVAPELPDLYTKDQISKLKRMRAQLKKNETLTAKEEKKKNKELREEISRLQNVDQRAAVDSELALVLEKKYKLAGWIKNPYFLGFQGLPMLVKKDRVLLVARLDGPDKKTVYRIIDDSLYAEKKGLQGNGYFDARWELPRTNNLSGYKLYDASLHKAAKSAAGRMKVVLDAKPELFPEKSCPKAALYCGWYSLAHYIDSFAWQRGAIGYHLASAECTTLRKSKRDFWCLRMLEKGVAATIGPVDEPYIQGFPLPEVFFSNLVEGYMSLGEAYLVSLPFLSWRMVLVGDPLYQPFSPQENKGR